MPVEVQRDEVLKLLEEGAQLVDVLSLKQYEEIHLAGAVSLPLRDLSEKSTAQLDRGRPVITYCYDTQ